jgi:branched-chain amino acid transport system permease protein
VDWNIGLILAQDGITSGAIYALLALSLVLVFTVTRVILLPQGEFVAIGALTYAALDAGRVPASIWLLGGFALAAFCVGLWRERRVGAGLLIETILLPSAAILLAWLVAPLHPPPPVCAVLALLIVTPIAPALYRLAFQRLAEASVLVLLIAAVGVDMSLVGLALLLFGPEGTGARGFAEGSLTWGPVQMPAQTLFVFGFTLLLIVGLFAFFRFTLAGKALRATAVNRLGARLVGIETAVCGRIAFTLAGFIGVLSGILIAPLTTIYYDSGFLIGLKGFVAAIIAGMGSYPGAALAALAVGLVESFSSFWASAFKEAIVFASLIPVLFWRSLRARGVEEE